MVKAYDEVQVVIATLECTRAKADEFHHDCFEICSKIVSKTGLEVKKPRTCRRQQHRGNAVIGNDSAEVYYRINVTIPLFDEVLESIKARVGSNQGEVAQGIHLVPAYMLTETAWKALLTPFISFYAEDLPSEHTLHAELELWYEKWEENWKAKLIIIKQQHIKATGEQMALTSSELNKLIKTNVPSNLASTLEETCPEFYPNIFYLLSVLAVLPITTCEAECSVSSLRLLKTYLRSTMGNERLTGLALMHIHQDVPVNITDIVEDFAIKHPRRMKLVNILNSDD